MPNELRQPKPTGRARRFGELAQVLQLQEGLNAPARQDRELNQRTSSDTLRAALEMMNLSQRGASDAATLQLGKEQMKANELAAGKRALVDAAQIASQPGIPGGVTEALKLSFPELAQGFGAAQAAETQRGIDVLEPQVKAVYGSGMQPGKMGPLLDALKMSNPTAFNALPWDQLNAAIPGAQTQAPREGVPDTLGGQIGSAIPGVATSLAESFPRPSNLASSKLAAFPADVLQGAGGITPDSRRSINDFISNIISAPAEGLQFYKNKLKRK